VNNGDEHEQENNAVSGKASRNEGSDGKDVSDKVSGNKGGGNKGAQRATSSCIIDYSTIKLSNISSAALNILNTIRSCKSLVRYVKKVRHK
jgi:hypothetical protein